MTRRGQVKRHIGAAVIAIPLLTSVALPQAAWAQGAKATVTVGGPKAPAAVTPPNAKKLLATAESKRTAGDYAGALLDYKASDALAPSPATIEGVAFCEDKLGHFDEALTWYAAFLGNVPPTLLMQADAAKLRVEAIKSLPGHLHLESAPSNALVTIDGKEQATHTPLDVDLPPGKHTLHLTAPEHDPIDRDIQVDSRSKANLALELLTTPPPPVAVVPPPPPPPPPPPARSLIPAYVTGGLAIVAAGVGVGFGIAALGDKSDFNKHPTTATANTGEDHALVADMGFGVALTLGVTSIVLFTTRNEATSPAAAPSTDAPKPAASLAPTFTAAPYVTPHGGGAGALLRF